jgi:dihydroorotase
VVATFFKGHPTVLNGRLNTPYRYTETVPAPDSTGAVSGA